MGVNECLVATRSEKRSACGQELELSVEKTDAEVTLRGAGVPSPSATGMALDGPTSVECAILAAASDPPAVRQGEG